MTADDVTLRVVCRYDRTLEVQPVVSTSFKLVRNVTIQSSVEAKKALAPTNIAVPLTEMYFP